MERYRQKKRLSGASKNDEIAFKVNTKKNIYMTTWKVKRERNNLLPNKEVPGRYLDKFLRNVQVSKQKECSIWLDDRTIMSELKI